MHGKKPNASLAQSAGVDAFLLLLPRKQKALEKETRKQKEVHKTVRCSVIPTGRSLAGADGACLLPRNTPIPAPRSSNGPPLLPSFSLKYPAIKQNRPLCLLIKTGRSGLSLGNVINATANRTKIWREINMSCPPKALAV